MMKRIISKGAVTNEQKLVDLLAHTVDEDGCRIWTRCLNTDGYPRMGGNVKVHRLVHELASKENLEGYVVRHTCDKPKCINPTHLVKGTHADNGNDKFVRDRQPRVVTKDIVFKVRKILQLNLLKQKRLQNYSALMRDGLVTLIVENIAKKGSSLVARILEILSSVA